MRLKRVRIFGFKTFADRTEVNLDGGVIAVVGPNGCGKSNLVDAILWGLGEGNSRHLRANSSQDVIFSGSAKRKPVGFAEVSLLFDNEDGALPIETPEVTITRRLNRAGDSEYSINRRTCRLRDIYDLLADSGLGRAGYAIVGQKEIDAALSASAEDRRAWVDEAAGVQRYRARKVESLRRLAAAQEHLSRVADILRELTAQREPLREEAEVAIRYKSVQESLREVELGLLIQEASAAVRELKELQARIDEAARLVREELARAESLDEQVRGMGLLISEIESEMDSIRGLQQGSLTALERAEANLALVKQRLESLDEQEKSLSEDEESAQVRIAEAESELREATEQEAAELANLSRLREELGGAGVEANRLRDSLTAVQRELAKAREAEARRLKREAEQAHQAERRTAVRRELDGIEATLPELEQGIAEAQTALDAQTAVVSEAQAQIKELEGQVLEVRRDEERDAQSVRQALSQKASLEGRRRGIEATIDAHEGLTQGTKAVLEAADRGLLDAEYTPVAEAVEADRELALAIETALGGSANDLIVDHDSDAKAAINWLKQNRAGRATFQPIPLMRPVEPSFELRRLLGERGVVGRASELVSCKARFRPVIDSLLGRVVVVQELDVALRLAKTSGWSRMVTLEGEIVHSSGAVTGGQQARQGYGMVQRKADLAELETELAGLDRTVREFDKRSAGRTAKRSQLDAALAEARERLAVENRESAENGKFLRTLLDERQSTIRGRDRLLRELELLDRDGEADASEAVDIGEVESRRDDLMKQLAARSADAEQAEARLREAETRVQQAQVRLYASRKRLQLAQEAEETRHSKLRNLGPLREKYAAEIVSLGEDQSAARRSREEADQALAKAHEERRRLLEQSYALTEQAKGARENAGSMGGAAHQAELSRARAESRRAAAFERLFEEYGLGEEDALRQEGQHEVPADAQSLVNRLRRELRAMGDVNLGAIDAFERLNQRVEELGAQQQDVLDGIAQVEASISELDKLTRDRFLSTFTALETSFSESFQKLFGGGEGKIALTDPTRVLESGIDLQITLPGKKRQPLQLLSGGERSLCCAAFLFSLLRVKPSPLVVLDEVDAPLDGRNVERFAAALHELTDQTQFIVITHNPTTIETAPVWLGVTMQEPGVSSLVPARLPSTKEILAEEAAVPVGGLVADLRVSPA
jgi:chromosome segregation protein